ncbi:2-dehydro-3-deoxyphosphogluconate aldolase / (4S)-4-hydroxy-2-oxoglutarate aldolase [Candidatus Planktophila versatilis]|uniref:bifunctional 4-hydroxy-2-oxoglutarate aldolase/2-dehydro-3-deoxy-phosphogluconate aldolase n=1 Tax=Candidatus Planktophila versatilis TaxID=1884905 RepID=UPI000BC0AD1E|nr:bifunctional 4-hydroxy-2-oxoglutarate aldolase/2-dehydro-3-deoxy-phosphogluconate aldolase [Candidatus Planktophila versatilis]ASY18930.1 2-dehydro-3-deoxyphosphogluconate aldolase / (4S)-4-hydroxy-2-oxoglutarate aldolase [Candidatus Planktophila versatilis]
MSALEEFEKSSIVAIIRTKTSAEGRSAAHALHSAGITSFEFTTTTPDVFDLIEEFSAIKGITVGVGTAMSPAHVISAKKAGATFVLSPHTDAAVIKKTLDLNLLSVPGVATPTDVARALQAGAKVLKLFPASHFGPAYLKAVRDPFPEAKWLATGGVSVENIKDWFAAGVLGFGVGGPLLGGGIPEIPTRVAAFIAEIKRVNSGGK